MIIICGNHHIIWYFAQFLLFTMMLKIVFRITEVEMAIDVYETFLFFHLKYLITRYSRLK